MEMVSASAKFPKEMVPYLEDKDQEQTFRRNAMMLYPYIKGLEISHGRAAEILGVRKRDLIEFYNSMGLPYLDQSKEDILQEISVYDMLKGKDK